MGSRERAVGGHRRRLGPPPLGRSWPFWGQGHVEHYTAAETERLKACVGKNSVVPRSSRAMSGVDCAQRDAGS